MADSQSELTNRMLHRYTELTESGVTNVHTIFAELATVVREHDGSVDITALQANLVQTQNEREAAAARLRDIRGAVGQIENTVKYARSVLGPPHYNMNGTVTFPPMPAPHPRDYGDWTGP